MHSFNTRNRALIMGLWGCTTGSSPSGDDTLTSSSQGRGLNLAIALREVQTLHAETKERSYPASGVRGGIAEEDFQRKGQESRWTGFHRRHGAHKRVSRGTGKVIPAA